MPRKASWYLQRLSKMPVGEIAYRVRHQVLARADRKRFRKLADSAAINFDCASFENRLPSFAADSHIQNADLSPLIDPLLERANRYCRHQITVFGIDVDYGDHVDWHLDPKTGKSWPLRFWAQIDTRDGQTIGGAKFVWEVNRLYGLHTLALAYRISENERYRAKLFEVISSWLDANPYPWGVNWTSGIELSVRIANLIWGLSHLSRSGFSDQERKLLCRFIRIHGRHLYRFPSKYSSNNNHAIAEAFALFLLGISFPELEEADKWRTFGRQVLDREVARQILPDGGSYEYSTTYLSFVFDFFLLYRLVCRENQIPYPAVVDQRLETACEFIYSLMDMNGNIANIGDQDSAVLVDFGLDNHENFQSILNTGAVLFHRPEWVTPSFPDFKTLALLGDRIRSLETNLHPSKPQAVFFKHSGLGLIRANTGPKEAVFAGNATPLGMPPLYAHGHLDAASFWLSAAGQELFVDPGTYLYHSGDKWRRYFRSTAAHNTVRIDGQDFTEQTGDFMFGRPYRITLHELQDLGDRIVWRAGHNAYERLRRPVTFVREVTFDRSSGEFCFVDTLTSIGSHSCEIFFHLHPACRSIIDGTNVKIGRENIGVTLEIDPRLSVQSFRGSDDPMLGWFSQHFNHIKPTTTIVCSGRFVGSVSFRNSLRIDQS